MSVSYIHVTFQYFTVIKVHQIPMRGVHYRAQSTLNDLASKQVYRRRYERRRSPIEAQTTLGKQKIRRTPVTEIL